MQNQNKIEKPVFIKKVLIEILYICKHLFHNFLKTDNSDNNYIITFSTCYFIVSQELENCGSKSKNMRPAM